LPLAVGAPARRGWHEFGRDPGFESVGSAFKAAVRAEDSFKRPCQSSRPTLAGCLLELEIGS
jgi:hypothetical protein